MARVRRAYRWMGWFLFLVLVLGLGLKWAVDNHPLETLDLIDGTFTGRSHGLRFAYGEHAEQHLLVFGETKGELHPVIIFFHGGSWVSGDPEGYSFMGRNLAREGYVVVVAGYRLGEKGRFPIMLEDCAQAYAWTQAHIADHGGDPSRVVLMGHSAGAYNSVMLALDRQWLGREGLDDSAIKGVVGFAGPYDFYPFDKDSTRAAFGHALRPQETQPITYARPDSAALLLLAGDEDTTVKPRNAIALAKAQSAAGQPSDPVIVEGLGHVGILLRMARPFDMDARVRERVLAFLRETTDPAAASGPVQPVNP